MSDLVGLCLFAVFIFVGLLLLLWVMNRFSRNAADPTSNPSQMPGSGRAPERPRHDDPDVYSEGQFGRRPGGATRPEYDDPDIGSTGGFGRERGGRIDTTPSASSDRGNPEFPAMGRRSMDAPSSPPPPAPRRDEPDHDDPDIRSRGGFGRDRN